MTKPAILIDGATGEGGGQILSSSLALSMATGQPFRMIHIRANRPKPGLMRQHLTCVQAAAMICGARVTGDAVGSKEITFVPGPVRAGEYHFAVGSAGGTSLVLQAVMPVLLRAQTRSSVTVTGGTHNTHAPPFDFVKNTLLPVLEKTGVSLSARLDRHGFYPAGGGCVVVDVSPTPRPETLKLLSRGERVGTRASALVARLARSIAMRELGVIRDRLGLTPDQLQVVEVTQSHSPGNAVLIELQFEALTETISSIGEHGKSAERVAEVAAKEACEYLESNEPVGPHLADQLMVPLAILAGGEFRAGQLTQHSRTNIATIQAFGGLVSEREGLVSVRPLLPDTLPA